MGSDRLRLIWNRLTEPAPDVHGPDQRRNARLLSALLIILGPLGYVIGLFPEVFGAAQPLLQNSRFIMITLTAGTLALAYVLSRTRHYRYGVLLTLIGSFVPIYGLAILESGDALAILDYFLVLILFSGIFLSIRATLGLLIVCLVAILSVPLFSPSTPLSQIIPEPIRFLLIGSGMILVSVRHRDQLEKDRRAALLASEARYRTLAEAAPDMIFILNRDGVVQYVNEFGAQQVNRRPEDIIGQTRAQLFPFEPGGGIQDDNVQAVFRSNQPLYLESQSPLINRETWLGTWLVPLTNEAGHTTAVMGIARDITSQKNAIRVQNAIYRISEAAQSTRNLDDLYRSIHLIIGELMPTENFYIALYDATADLITFPYLVDRYEDATPVKPGRGLTSYVLRTGQPILFTPEVHSQLVARGEISMMGHPSIDWLGAPLKTAERIIGVIAVQTYDPKVRLRTADKDILVFVSSQVAMAIERKRAAEAEHEQRRLAEALRDTAAALNSTLNLDEVLDQISIGLGRVLPHTASNIMLIDDTRTEIHIVRASGYPDLGSSVLSLADYPTLRQPIETQRLLIIADTRGSAGWVTRPETQWIRSHLAAPIKVKNQVIGLLNVDSDQPDFYTAAHGEHLQAFAHQAALAIENARLHQALNRYADELEQRVNERTRQLAEANDRLQELDRMKDQFVSNVSHELRTPMANVKLYLNLLTKGKPEKYAVYLKTLQHETARLEKLIEDLLDLSRLDLGSTVVNLAPTDVNQVVKLLVADRAFLAAEHGLRLQYHLASGLPMAQADPLRLEQVIANLLANAVNYTPAGGQIDLITAQREVDGLPWITVSVADTGPGIAPKDLPHLFERFYRGEVGRKSGTPGTGLGLAICHEILVKIGGHITVASPPDQGARFTVWLKPLPAS